MKVKINYPDRTYTLIVDNEAKVEADGAGTITIKDKEGNEIGEFYDIDGYFLED